MKSAIAEGITGALPLTASTLAVPRGEARNELSIRTDKKLLSRIVASDYEALGSLIDRWADPLYAVTDALRLDCAEADGVIEEVFRRLIFEAPAISKTGTALAPWIRDSLRQCAAAVVARREVRARTVKIVKHDVAPPPAPAETPVENLIEGMEIPGALSYLNSLTPFRFTAVYRFDGLSIVSLHIFDRESVDAVENTVARVSDTYCLWIQETLSVVQMTNSLLDPRAVDHPNRETVQSYCGGPIRDLEGGLFGTICHFDYEPRQIPVDVMRTLEKIGPYLSRALAS